MKLVRFCRSFLEWRRRGVRYSSALRAAWMMMER